MAAEFEKEHPDIKVEIVVTDWDTYKSKITTAISADNALKFVQCCLQMLHHSQQKVCWNHWMN
ncbi:MAG: extracellular solute-binding protein [Ruminococcus sp.]